MANTRTSPQAALKAHRDALRAAGRRRERAMRAQEAATSEIADLAVEARGAISMAEIARLAGVTRKTVYDLIAWRTGEKSIRH